MTARKISVHQNKKEKLIKKTAMKFYKMGYSTRVVADMLAQRGMVRSKMWVWRLVTKGRQIKNIKK